MFLRIESSCLSLPCPDPLSECTRAVGLIVLWHPMSAFGPHIASVLRAQLRINGLSPSRSEPKENNSDVQQKLSGHLCFPGQRYNRVYTLLNQNGLTQWIKAACSSKLCNSNSRIKKASHEGQAWVLRPIILGITCIHMWDKVWFMLEFQARVVTDPSAGQLTRGMTPTLEHDVWWTSGGLEGTSWRR